jgi:hypothetical protein
MPGIHATMEPLATRLERALTRFRIQAAHNLLDEAFSAGPADVVARELVLPLYDRVEAAGDPAVVRFAASLFEIRLLGQARGWERIDGPRVTLACAPREPHTLPLIALGLALAGRHCRMNYLGGFTPVAAVAEQPADLLVLGIETDDLTPHERTALRALEPVLMGRAAPGLARELGAVALPPDLEVAAVRAASTARRRSSRPGDATSPAQR